MSSALSTTTRHCAFCLKEMSDEEMKTCSGCRKRVYCSEECQDKDWKPSSKMNGTQGHQNWCGIEYGEEDIDWKVTPIEGKGLGIVALRDIPASYRIIVEGVVDHKTHPRVAELMPVGGTRDQKFNLNKLGCGDHDDEVLCLRIARANHSCDANASHVYDKSLGVKILFALRDVKKGEEICFSYVGFFDIRTPHDTPECYRERLGRLWGITCDQNCLCYNKEYLEKVSHARELDKSIFRLGKYEGDVAGAIAKVKELLELEKELGIALFFMKRTLYDGFQVAIMKRKFVDVGVEFMTQAYEMNKKIRHPEKNEEVLRYKMYMENPAAHPAYMFHERTVHSNLNEAEDPVDFLSENMTSIDIKSKAVPATRHCAFCLKEIRGDEIKKCSKCHKRAYCSRECQLQDWIPKDKKGKGQGHKVWCGIDCGEEDVDWEVTPMEGKGLGIVARRDMPVGYRIIVESSVMYSNSYPRYARIADLMPYDGSLKEKVDDNSILLLLEEENGSLLEKPVLCLRIARANHSCDANAAIDHDRSVEVLILYAIKDIKEGDEICFAYLVFNDISLKAPLTPELCRDGLRTRWGIVCDQNCLCYNKEYCEKVVTAWKFDKMIRDLGNSGKTEQALVTVEELLELEKELGLNFARMRRTNYDGFQASIMKRSTMKYAVEYITEAYELAKKIFHPQLNELVRKYKMYKEDPSKGPWYMIYEYDDCSEYGLNELSSYF